jgi:type II secretory pathway pseudopilin PulG
LVELLVVVAILSVLAATALPNFLEAQIRSKVALAKNDIRTIAVALEVYHTDNGRYPETFLTPRWQRFECLTTPIAYLTHVPRDPFEQRWDLDNHIDWGPRHFAYKMGATPLQTPHRYAISSNGPDLDEDSVPIKAYPGFSWEIFTGQDPDYNYMIYDPTNGTVSNGDIWRTSDHPFN